MADLCGDLPFRSHSVDFIHSEDFFVQLDLVQGQRFLRECRRILKPTGVMRLLTPDLQSLVEAYLQRPEWLVRTWNTFVGVPLHTQSACEVVNRGMRMAGQFHYDRQTLAQVAQACGFRIAEVEYNQSRHPELRGIDLRRPHESVSMYFECVPDA